MTRMMTASITPPLKPATRPIGMPINADTSDETMPTNSDTRAPYSTRDKQVASEIVGAEQVDAARRRQHAIKILLCRAIGREQRRKDRDEDQQGDDHQPETGQPMARHGAQQRQRRMA